MFAVLFLLAAFLDESYRVPAHEYRFVPVRVSHWPAALTGNFQVTRGGPVRLELLSKAQLGNFIRGRAYEVVVALDARSKGSFQQPLPEEGDYDFVLINGSDQADEVELRSDVQFAAEPDVARYLAPEQRRNVILVTLLVFALLLGWSGWRLLRAMRRGRTGGLIG